MAGGTTADETKKAVCKAFTSVVKSSVLAVDPKTFFMMLNTNYAVLVRDRRIDLGPLWDAMVAEHANDQLYGVFLMFRMRAMDLGFKVLLPKAVDALSEDEMRQALQPWTGVMVPDEPTPYEPLPLALNSSDIKPFIPDETRRKVVQIASTAIRNSPIGAKFDAAKLAFQIDSAFDLLFDGMRFDFAQIFDVLRQSENLDDTDIYRVIARAKIDLTAIGLGVVEPNTALNTIEKQNITDDIRRTEERRQRSTGSLDLEKPSEEQAKPRATTKEERLKEYGLESVNEKVKKRGPIRIALLAVLLVAGGVAIYLTRPDRPLPHEHYSAILPVKSAYLISNSFQCIIDDARWYKIPPQEREERMKKFEALLFEEGNILDMQCRDTFNRLVISAISPSRIAGATFFMRGDADGTIPKSAVVNN